MAKYDIILVTGNTGTTGISGETFTFSGLTSKDGSLVTSGILKFESRFLVGRTDVMVIPQFYRSRPLFEAKFGFLEILNYPREFYVSFTEEEFYQITPAIMFTKVCDYLNTLLKVVAFEILEY